MNNSILNDCLRELQEMTDEEVVQKCKELGLYKKYNNEKYIPDDFELILPDNNINK